MYMQARYYDPVIGRFYSNDPIGFRDVHSFNRYAYANNNPYKYVDPTGMCSISNVQKFIGCFTGKLPSDSRRQEPSKKSKSPEPFKETQKQRDLAYETIDNINKTIAARWAGATVAGPVIALASKASVIETIALNYSGLPEGTKKRDFIPAVFTGITFLNGWFGDPGQMKKHRIQPYSIQGVQEGDKSKAEKILKRLPFIMRVK